MSSRKFDDKLSVRTLGRFKQFRKVIGCESMRYGARSFLILSSLLLSPVAFAYDSSCSSDAGDLERAAQEYDSALSEFEDAEAEVESAKSSYDSACNSGWGYSRDDEGACGSYGYKTNELRSALDELESAESDLQSAQSTLEYALSSVSSSCGDVGAGMSPLMQTCLGELQRKTSDLATCELKLRSLPISPTK